MNANIIDVLVYLFENYITEKTDLNQHDNQMMIYSGLQDAGFERPLIDSAFAWLGKVKASPKVEIRQSKGAIRLYTAPELNLLDDEGVDFIQYLEATEILKPSTRELLLNALHDLNADNIDVDDLQWLALIILYSQPDEEQAFASMERLMFDPPVDHEH